jgi:hypothetical protein
VKHLRQYIRKLIVETIEDELDEELEMASNVVLAFLGSANQGIIFAETMGGETGELLHDYFEEIRVDIQQMIEAEPTQDIQLRRRYQSAAQSVVSYLDDLLLMAGFHEPYPEGLTNAVADFMEDVYNSFKSHWFPNLPDQKQQQWIDWLGGDL